MVLNLSYDTHLKKLSSFVFPKYVPQLNFMFLGFMQSSVFQPGFRRTSGFR